MTSYAKEIADFDKVFKTVYDSTIEFFSFNEAANEAFVDCLRYMATTKREFQQFICNLTTYNENPTTDNLNKLEESPFTQPPAYTCRFDAFHEKYTMIRADLFDGRVEIPDPFKNALDEIAKLRPVESYDWKKELINVVSRSTAQTFPIVYNFHRGGINVAEYNDFTKELGLTTRWSKLYLNAENVGVNGEYADVKKMLNERRESSARGFLARVATEMNKSHRAFEVKEFKCCPASSYHAILNRLRGIGIDSRSAQNGTIVLFWKI